MLPFIGENNCIPRSPLLGSFLNMRMRLAEPTKWDSFTVSAQVLLIWVVTQLLPHSHPSPPSFTISWHTFTSPSRSPLFTPLMPGERPMLHANRRSLNPQHHPPIHFTHAHAESCFELPLKCDRSHLTGDTHTHTWCYRVRARDSASWVMRDCHLHCLSTIQDREGEMTERRQGLLSLFEVYCSRGKRGQSKEARKNPQQTSEQKRPSAQYWPMRKIENVTWNCAQQSSVNNQI